jgi:hypothetical protein
MNCASGPAPNPSVFTVTLGQGPDQKHPEIMKAIASSERTFDFGNFGIPGASPGKCFTCLILRNCMFVVSTVRRTGLPTTASTPFSV